MTSGTINGYVTIAVDADLRARIYGPYPTEPGAQDLATTIGFSDSSVIAARVTPLADPDLSGLSWQR